MEEGNHSEVTEFILSRLTDRPELQLPLFVLTLLVYDVILMGNGGLIWLITTDPRLHTPMYFFLRSLSFCDICLSSLVALKMSLDFLAVRKSISRTACAVQMYFSTWLGQMQSLLLAVMAYDRCFAICNPLRYMVTMSRRRCNQLVAGVCAVGLVDAAILTSAAFQLSFCSSNVINHSFCDVPPVLALSCSDTRLSETLVSAVSGFFDLTCAVPILLSYVYIFSHVLQNRSAEGWHKTFSTCACHLTSVVLFYGTGLFEYFPPNSSYSMDKRTVVSVLYALVIPVLNPLVYSFRNREVKGALRKTMNKLLSNS